MKKKLRQSLIVPEVKPQHLQPQQLSIQFSPLQNQEVLKVSPTTKLPHKSDRILMLHPPEEYEIRLNLSDLNLKKSLVTDKTDYSNGKYNAVPDARSITQSTQYIGQGAGAGVNIGDADPVRAFQSYKARKRKEKVDKIKKAYAQD